MSSKRAQRQETARMLRDGSLGTSQGPGRKQVTVGPGKFQINKGNITTMWTWLKEIHKE